jgi:hypothetical protein
MPEQTTSVGLPYKPHGAGLSNSTEIFFKIIEGGLNLLERKIDHRRPSFAINRQRLQGACDVEGESRRGTITRLKRPQKPWPSRVG